MTIKLTLEHLKFRKPKRKGAFENKHEYSIDYYSLMPKQSRQPNRKPAHKSQS